MNIEPVKNFVRNPYFIQTTYGIACCVAGGAAGYFLGKHREYKRISGLLEEHHDRTIEEAKAAARGAFDELEQRRATARAAATIDREEYEALAGQYSPPLSEEESREVHPSHTDVDETNTWEDQSVDTSSVEYDENDGESKPVDPVKRNVFATASSADDGWDYEVEKRNRDSVTPYVIHEDEFYGDPDEGYSTFTYTYFDGDDVLIDEDNNPIFNFRERTGEFESKFGHGARLKNVVHIRNEKRQEKYEIVKDDGFYSAEILGLQIEPNDRARDGQTSTPRRFRQEE